MQRLSVINFIFIVYMEENVLLETCYKITLQNKKEIQEIHKEIKDLHKEIIHLHKCVLDTEKSKNKNEKNNQKTCVLL